MDPLLDEPLVCQRVGLPHRAQHRGRWHPDVVEDELRVAVGERVHVVRVVLQRHARRVVIDEEERRQPFVAVDHDAVENHEIGVVGACDEPLLAVEDVVPGGLVSHRGRRERSGVGAGGLLGDGVAAGPLAAERGIEVPLALLRRRVDQRVVGAGDVRPEPTRDLAQLLMNDHLLQDRPALATDLPRQRAALKSGLDRGVAKVAPLFP